MSDGFWDVIEAQLKELRTATTADEVLGILSLERNPLGPGVTSADGFFAGSGGEGSVWESLIAAGWYTIWSMASCHWAMRSPDSRDAITYVEGDIYRGNRRPV